ncbi:TIGR00366 family protein [Natrinema zhouii]|uniref:Short-chain fatty acid transporter n=1 Tax=Natrinema zhouii TaxID=1710539 RepID=A0A7D6CRK5_9EURY|nr:TIGR00366 family protein [Natrinema zhouii]QLK26133.1 TIGR00366 family protein [Natrinema zhouii]
MADDSPSDDDRERAVGTDGGTPTATDTDRNAFVPAFGKYFPESLVTGLLLAVLALVVTVPFLEPMTQLELFGTGFYDLFSLQMFLILFWLLSATVVESPRVGALFDRLATVLPASQRGIVFSTAFVSLSLGWLNWALGLVGGVLVGQRLCHRARERGIAVHYPLVLTGGLSALVVANQGLSSPGALLMADESGVANIMLEDAGSVAMSEFVLHPVNLLSSVLFVVTIPLVLVALAPSDDTDIRELDARNRILEGSIAETLAHYSPTRDEESWELGDRLENAESISLLAVVIGLASAGWHFATGGALTLPWLAFTLMILGLAVQGPPMAFKSKTRDATRWTNHVAIPFLFYAGVVALLSEAELYGPIGDVIAGTQIPAVASYPLAFALGLLVPDPGSVWVIQGPAIAAADVDLVAALVSVMYAAGVSNLWLGFVFAGILSISGFDWLEFAKYAGVITLYVSAVVLGLLLVF